MKLVSGIYIQIQSLSGHIHLIFFSKSDLPSLLKSSKNLKVKSLGEVSSQFECFNETSGLHKSVANKHGTSIADSNLVMIEEAESESINNEMMEKVGSNPAFYDNLEEEMDEEEKILYLDQNNQIITNSDQHINNKNIETAIREDSLPDTLLQGNYAPEDNAIDHGNQMCEVSEIMKEPTCMLPEASDQIMENISSTIKSEKKKIEVEVEFDDFQSQQPLSPSKMFSVTGPQYRKKQSKVWTYFEKSSDGSKVVCNYCGEVQRFMSNTTNMIRHIEKVHSNKGKKDSSQPIRRIKQLRRKVCQRSPVWKYFHRIAHLNKVQCKLCLENYSFSGNTTNLRFHMRTRHADIYDKIDEELAKDNDEKKTEEINDNEVKGAETISVEVCNLESGDLGGPVYVATAPTDGYLL